MRKLEGDGMDQYYWPAAKGVSAGATFATLRP